MIEGTKSSPRVQLFLSLALYAFFQAVFVGAILSSEQGPPPPLGLFGLWAVGVTFGLNVSGLFFGYRADLRAARQQRLEEERRADELRESLEAVLTCEEDASPDVRASRGSDGVIRVRVVYPDSGVALYSLDEAEALLRDRREQRLQARQQARLRAGEES